MKIRIDHIAKIEGHASFTADIVKGDIKSAKIKIEEGARLFEGIMRKRKDVEIPELGSRICGVCPVVHNLTGFKALENAFKIAVEEPASAVSLRKLMMLGQLINSHCLHLFFFSLSDFFGFKSDLELINQYPEKTNNALKVRGVGNKLVEVIGGRTIHPLTPCVGGIRQVPDLEKLKKLLEDCKNILPSAIKLGELFIELKYPDFVRETTFVSLTHPAEYAIYDGEIKANYSEFKIKDFLSQVKEFQAKDKVAKRTHLYNRSYMVGALARLHNNRDKLNIEARKLLEKSGLKFPCHNPFHNILAQAVEVVHCFEEAIRILEKLFRREIEVGEKNVKNRTGEGIGAIEAPRGTLFYALKIKDGIVEKVNIITPTAQNIANLEDDLEELEKLVGFKDLTLEEKQDKIKMLIRAYDPCVTCSVH
jgi:coenzyme F420-reducing hydrogenase alpha subunit